MDSILSVPYYVTASVTAAGVLGGAYLAYRLSQDKPFKLPETWEHVGVLKEINVYPIKSCAPVLLNTAECTYLGLKDGWLRDRVLMVVDNKNNFLTARGYPELLAVFPTVRNSILTLKHANMEPVNIDLAEVVALQKPKTAVVWGDKVPVYDCGWEASEWFSRYAERNNLVSAGRSRDVAAGHILATPLPHPHSPHTSAFDSVTSVYCNTRASLFTFIDRSSTNYRLAYYASEKCRKVRGIFNNNKLYKFTKNDTGAFPDEASYHLVNEASVDDLKTRLQSDSPVTMRNFRPNFVLTGPKPYDEDKWKFIKIGENVFRVIKPCMRCTLTTIDPETGVRNSNSEPMTELKKYRQAETAEERKSTGNAPRMGLLMTLVSGPGGMVSLNDPIYVA